MQIWKAHYRDKYHDTLIDIINTGGEYQANALSFTLDGIVFQGRGFGDFELAKATQYDEAKEKFCILKSGGYSLGGDKVPYWYELQRYALDIEIPVKVCRKRDNSETQGVIYLSFEYIPNTEKNPDRRCDHVMVCHDDVTVHDFTLCVDGINYSSAKKTLWFQLALLDICKQMSQDYYIKCCFTCQYSDYSPYGDDDYGTMLCYRNCKEDYLKVNNKDDFLNYLGQDYETRQETYLCGEYDLRNRCPGLRGFVDGVKDI